MATLLNRNSRIGLFCFTIFSVVMFFTNLLIYGRVQTHFYIIIGVVFILLIVILLLLQRVFPD